MAFWCKAFGFGDISEDLLELPSAWKIERNIAADFVYSNLQIYLIKRIMWTCIWVVLCIFRPSPLNDIMFLL